MQAVEESGHRPADEVLSLVRAEKGPPLVVVTGPAGAGRMAVLDGVGRALRDQGRTVLDVRIAHDGGLLVGSAEGTAWHEQGTVPFGPTEAPAPIRRSHTARPRP